jgi:hypothetical protein
VSARIVWDKKDYDKERFSSRMMGLVSFGDLAWILSLKGKCALGPFLSILVV